MKIVCDNCATKYSIADEKVRGKVFKIRCKKCSHIIVVRGSDGSAPAPEAARENQQDPAFPDDQTIARDSIAMPPAASPDAVWHLVIDREQVGPLTAEEVREKFAAHAIDAETYTWREGFADWSHLGEIADFRDLAGRSDSTARRSESADLFASSSGADESAPQDSGDLFGNANANSGPQVVAASVASGGSDELFSSPNASGGLFGAVGSAPAPARQARSSSPGFAASGGAAMNGGDEQAGAGGGDSRHMTGQRNENSVLFSLNNLQALATGGGASSARAGGADARPGYANLQTEGSGLIDIRAMAASTLAASPSGGTSRGEELPGFSNPPVFSPMAAPILMPAAAAGPPKWIWAVLAVGVLALVGIVFVGALLINGKKEAAVVAVAPPVESPANSPLNPSGRPSTNQIAPSAAAMPNAAKSEARSAEGNPKSEAQDEGDSHRGKHGNKEHPAKAEKISHSARAEATAASPVPAPAEAAPPPPAPKKSSKHDELDDLLNGASPDKAPARHAAAPAAESSGGGGGGDDNLPDQLDKGAIVGGMMRIKGKVAACNEQFKVPGMANVAVTISKSGKVSNAVVGGIFSGTPTGDCVAKAVRSASFPAFKGPVQTINYPFMLR